MPVLSEHITVVAPKVSIASKFLIRQFFFEIRLAIKVSATVIVASRPSGTLATKIDIKKITESSQKYP